MTTLRRAAAAVTAFVAEVAAQLRATTWPTRRATAAQTGIVLVFLVLMVAVIGGADTGLAALMGRVFG